MNSHIDEHGNQILTFETGAEVVIPPRQVLINQRQAALDKVAEDAVRAALALEPDCGRTCGDKYPQCDCHKCAQQKGFFTPEEKEKSFTEQERAFIDSMWDPDKGFLGELGCRLPRTLRPIACIRNICILDTNLKKYEEHYAQR